MIELFSDPATWVGLFTLIVLEIVLGIDNLVFIAIIASRLPPRHRDTARIVGLSLALFMRLGLLAAISWLVTLTEPLFSVFTMEVSGRDLILFIGGLFLLYKATTELHARLEGSTEQHGPKTTAHAGLWIVITQIVVLDAVFSLDSVITAVGMVDDLPVMMAAVVISVGVMLFASKPLTVFVNAHPTVVVLCLAFLLMIGLSLVAEGLGFHLPKGYLYAAIGFSILIESFNQVAQRNYLKNQKRGPLRERTAEAVFRLLAGPIASQPEPAMAGPAYSLSEKPAFTPEERQMVRGVLTLGERSLHSLMTPRTQTAWIDIERDPEEIRQQIYERPHSRYPVARGTLDHFVGVVRAKDAMYDIVHKGRIDDVSVRNAIVLPEDMPVLRAIRKLRESNTQLALVKDEHGVVQGVVTPLDILEAIAGDFPEEGEGPTIRPWGHEGWHVDGNADLHYLELVLETTGLVDEADRYATVAGLAIARLQRPPQKGDRFRHKNFEFHVTDVSGNRVRTMEVKRVEKDTEENS